LATAHGADAACGALITEIEQADVTFLPGRITLPTHAAPGRKHVAVQPDAMIPSPFSAC
jgi:hypothetical protein